MGPQGMAGACKRVMRCAMEDHGGLGRVSSTAWGGMWAHSYHLAKTGGLKRPHISDARGCLHGGFKWSNGGITISCKKQYQGRPATHHGGKGHSRDAPSCVVPWRFTQGHGGNIMACHIPRVPTSAKRGVRRTQKTQNVCVVVWCVVCVCVCVCVCGFGWGFRPSITYIYSGIEPPRQKRACTHALDAHAHAHAHARSSQRHMLSHEALYIAAALWDNQGPQLRHA
jgi:hypothetical protein